MDKKYNTQFTGEKREIENHLKIMRWAEKQESQFLNSHIQLQKLRRKKIFTIGESEKKNTHTNFELPVLCGSSEEGASKSAEGNK